MSKKNWFDVILSLVIMLILVYALPSAITGFYTNDISVSIESTTAIEVSAFDYDTFVTLAPLERQNTTVEIRNIGSENYTARIELFIYFFENGALNEKAHFYDSEVHLHPGMRRMFTTIFTATQRGFYYIKIRTTYGTKRMEAWGSFYAGYNIVNTTPGPGGGGGGGTGTDLGGGVPAKIYYVSLPELNLTLEYPEEIFMNPGDSVLTSIKAKNVGGNRSLHEIRLYVSTSNIIDIDFSPKELYYLDANKSAIFVLDIDTRTDIPYGTYPIDFEVVTREIMKTGTISLNIVAYNISLEEDVRNLIFNYEYIITELETQIFDAYKKGFNVNSSERLLNNAKINMRGAKNYYNMGDFENALLKLGEVKEDLKATAFQLGQDTFVFITAPAFGPLWVLVIGVAAGIIFLFVLRRRSKKEKLLKKPKLLKGYET